MDLARHLRARQDDVDRLAADLAAARGRLDTAAIGYDRSRRYAPASANTSSARTAWAVSLHEWAQALIAHATARDGLAAERHGVDQAAEDAALAPFRRPS